MTSANAAKHQNYDWKKNATFYTAKTRFAIEGENGYEVYPCNLVVVEPGNGERYVYDLTDIGKPTHAAKVNSTPATPLNQSAQVVTATAVSANPTPRSIPNSTAGAQGGKRAFNGVTPEEDAAYAEAVKRGESP